MSDTINDGGPAFPQTYCPTSEGRVESPWTDGFGGMTLRDWFAGMALAGMAEKFLDTWTNNRPNDTALGDVAGANKEEVEYTVADACYAVADAMLQVRQTPDTPAAEAEGD